MTALEPIIKEIFNTYDEERKGYVDRETAVELVTDIFHKADHDYKQEEIVQVIDNIKEGKKDKITENELKRMLKMDYLE